MNTKSKKTSDIYLASALSALGAKLEDVDKTDPRHMVFEFSPRTVSDGVLSELKIPTLDLDFIETQWVNRTLQVNASDYAEAIKRLKSVVHSK